MLLIAVKSVRFGMFTFPPKNLTRGSVSISFNAMFCVCVCVCVTGVGLVTG